MDSASGDACCAEESLKYTLVAEDSVPQPDYIAKRLELWQKFKKEADAELAAKDSKPITITLPDGKAVPGEAWRSTPYSIAAGISKGLADSCVVAKVNNVLWDLDRPFEDDSSLKLLKFDDDEAKSVFWHSSAHILGEALERFYGGWLCHGPPVEEGFFYDMFLKDEKSVSSSEYKKLDAIVKQAIKEKQVFERLELTKDQLLMLFDYNPFKKRILEKKVTTDKTTAYRCGPLIDLCRGPHIRHTGKLKAFEVTKNSSSYWEGKADQEVLNRVYGISFPDSKQMKEWKKFQEEAAKRDHRKLGREQELFMFHELSPGSCFFLPKGTFIYNTLVDYIKAEYHKRGFDEIITPNMYNSKLWQTSGHWQHYQDSMFITEVEKQQFGLKPMNCPGHCLVFSHRPRSWRELPLRWADFGVLHRNELSGALTGLVRVRRFQQDDGHIFCTMEQLEDEIKGALEFLKEIYDTFGFTFRLNLSTRPEKYLGDINTWNAAEKVLESALNNFGLAWKLNEGDGAFYGPKIDIQVTDALRRQHQCATIQLDFQLPIRFDLSYSAPDGDKKRPVIIHRAILGSVERMIAILTENFGGKWPFWLSPRQSCVVPVAPAFEEYAGKVKQAIHDAGFICDTDLDVGLTLNKKIRRAQLDYYNFILVVGEKELANNSVNVRTRDNKIHGEIALDELIEKFGSLNRSKVLCSENF